MNLSNGNSYQIDDFPFSKNVNVVTGIANPIRFLETLNGIKINYDFKLYPDHHFSQIMTWSLTFLDPW